MFSTPLQASYYDNPIDNLEFLKSLDEGETKLYTLGYVQACHQILEALGDSKRRFLAAALGEEPEHPMQARLLSFVKLLDSLDESLISRVDFLTRSVLNA